MLSTKIGFAPSNWEDWNGGNYAETIRDRCVEVLRSIPGLDLVVPSKELTHIGCVSSIEDAKKVIELFRREDIQGLIIGNMDFGMEVAVGALLNGIRKDMPILHFATRSAPYLPNGSRMTDTWCGQFMTTAAIKRRGFRFVHIRTCNPEDEYFQEHVELFARSVCAISRFERLKIGQLGTRPQVFESQVWNEQAMQKRFRQMVVPMDLDTVHTRIEAIDPKDPEVQRVVRELYGMAEVSEQTEESMINLARTEVGYRKIATELDVSALAIACWTRIEERLHVDPCVVLGRLVEQGLMAGDEVDVYGTMTMVVFHSAALGAAKPHFIDWTDLHPEKPNVWLAWHCGNAPISACAANSRPKLVRNERMVQWCETCHGALEFRLKDGPVTCGRLVEYDGEFCMFYGSGAVIDIPPFVRGAYGWVQVNDVYDWEKKLVECGVYQHGVLIHDPKVAKAMDWFCTFAGIKAVQGA